MKTKEIKEMNANERLNHAIMLMNSYAGLTILDIVNGYNPNEVWVRNARAAKKLVDGMLKMRDIGVNAIFYLR